MSIPTRLEAYLNVLNKSLGAIPLSDRSDIITEIKSHVLEAMERDPNQNLETLLQSLGEPEQVANRYLLERGLKPSKPPKRPIMQWLVIGGVSTFAIMLLFIGFIVWRFTPIIDVNEKEERVSLLGGMINVNGTEGTIKLGEEVVQMGKNSQRVAGNFTMKDPSRSEVWIPFTNGKVQLETSGDNKLRWDCSSYGGAPQATEDQINKYKLDFSGAKGMKCRIEVPANAKVALKGSNGKVEIERPRYNVDLTLDNGAVEIEPNRDSEYSFVTKVVNGHVDEFKSSPGKGAFQISVNLVNGKISNGDAGNKVSYSF